MTNNEPDWEHVRAESLAILEDCRDALGAETAKAVRHYLDHDEYEMAVEGLCLDLLARESPTVDWQRCLSLARRVGLDKVSVFDAEFWVKLSARAERDA